MSRHKTYWAIINDEPTRCTVRDKIYDDKIWLVHPANLPQDCMISLRKDFVHESKEACIQHALEILAKYYSDGERDIKQRQMQQTQLFHKMEVLKKELEEKHAKRGQHTAGNRMDCR